MGWACTRLEVDPPTLYVSTPLALPGGKPLDFYLTERAGLIEFNDDGLTIFCLRGLGYAMDDRRHWRGIINIATELGFNVDDSGSIAARFQPNDLRARGASIVRLFSRILDWQIEHFQASDADQTLADEVERILRLRDPLRAVERPAIARLPNTEDLRFDFLWGNEYVDAVPPVAKAVSSRLRKAIQFHRGGGAREDLLFVVDNRGDELEAATRRELPILAEVARTVRLTDFARAA